MKKRILEVFLVFMLTAGIIAVFSGCSTGVEAAWSIYGTWINEDYEGVPEKAAKMVISSDETIEIYFTVDGSDPDIEGTFEVMDQWTEAGILWLEAEAFVDGVSHYGLHRIMAGGDVTDQVNSTSLYPSDITYTDPKYQIHYRE